jgi:hypothetical protein
MVPIALPFCAALVVPCPVPEVVAELLEDDVQRSSMSWDDRPGRWCDESDSDVRRS